MVEMMPGMAKIDFAMGSHGLEWNGCNVVRASCQARLLGVKPGWSINMINGIPVTDSFQILENLNKCKKSGRKYSIYFVKDDATIRAEQAKADQESQKRQKDLEAKRQRDEQEKQIREAAEKKKADEREAKKQEYWDKQNPAAAPEAAAEAAPAEAEAPAADAPAEGGEEAPAEEPPAEE
eukprot:gnl/TRDRNA2_/TRDRNA2_183861_c0_seq1.p1 gnl/TRDRNA2_/TRDRNA2_183861_c0~~gnl/TRDRNA2_/TRDRNA2_183861_c0_seq1.p1  ORF type:complete len:180 (-),score=67.78 gnl/TRDRNA2_/TRDRNA2_183861_c0_seq1:78-617(-)